MTYAQNTQGIDPDARDLRDFLISLAQMTQENAWPDLANRIEGFLDMLVPGRREAATSDAHYARGVEYGQRLSDALERLQKTA